METSPIAKREGLATEKAVYKKLPNSDEFLRLKLEVVE